ncbi:MAG: HAD-IA family hydrolase [Bacteroidetes bacterium]|nr:HAD-IA family hydrolase [Bacteroidota bacterium]
MNKHTEIKYILFDLDNTLYPASSRVEHAFNNRIVTYVSKFMGISEEEADELRAKGFIKHGTTVSWLIAEHGLKDIEDYLDWIHMKDIGNYITPNPDLAAMLKRIKIPRSILTNAIREHAERVLEVLDIRHEFDKVFDIRDYNFNNKPSPIAYNTALSAINVPVENILFIDDNIHFMQPFIDLGGQVLLIDEDQKHLNSAYPSIRKITELENFLNKR